MTQQDLIWQDTDVSLFKTADGRAGVPWPDGSADMLVPRVPSAQSAERPLCIIQPDNEQSVSLDLQGRNRR